jgi:hypothetical protein
MDTTVMRGQAADALSAWNATNVAPGMDTTTMRGQAADALSTWDAANIAPGMDTTVMRGQAADALSTWDATNVAPGMDTTTVNSRMADSLAAWNTANVAPGMPSVDMDDFNEQVALVFQTAMPATKEAALETPRQTSVLTQSTEPQSIHAENIYVNVQAEDCGSLLDFVRMLMQSVHQPEAAAL